MCQRASLLVSLYDLVLACRHERAAQACAAHEGVTAGMASVLQAHQSLEPPVSRTHLQYATDVHCEADISVH